MKCELRNVKTNTRLSKETACFSADLYIDGKKAAEAENAGHGGCTRVVFLDKEVAAKFREYLKTLPPVPCEWGDKKPFEMDEELFIGELLERHEELKFLRRKCARKTLFRLKGARKGEYQELNMPFGPAVKQWIEKKYGDRLEEICNEAILSPA